MENIFSFNSLLPCFSCLVLATLVFRSIRKKKNLPPSPPALPIIGHLHLLKKPIHQIFHNLSSKYGPVISLKLGVRLAIIVSSPSAVEECFTKNDIIFANRPKFLMGKYLNYDFTTLGASDYGDHWRNLRRLATLEILSATRLNMFSSIRKDEVRALLRRLSRVSDNGLAKVQLRPMFLGLNANVVMRMMAGKKYFGEEVDNVEEAKEFREICEEFFELAEMAHISDLFPILQCFDFGGFIKRMDTVGKRTDKFLQRIVDEHRVDKGRNTMISHLLKMQEEHPEYYTDVIIKGLVMILLVAGTKTTTTSLEWAISNLVNNPKVYQKLKDELDSQVGKNRLIEESDFSKLLYLQCVVKENLRLCPPIPLLAPHTSSEDCTIAGYDIPRGAILFVNAYTIHRDPKIWEDPTSFKPERFEDGRIEGSKMIPFGMGRRSCPGEGLAHRVIGLALGSLIQSFEWKKVSEEKLDMTERLSVSTLSRAEPLTLLCQPRPTLQNFLA